MNTRTCLGAARAGLGIALTAMLAACGGGAGNTVPAGNGAAQTQAQSQAPSAAARAIGAVARADGGFDATLMHGTSVPLEFQTQPGAACTTATTKPGHEILADALGYVRVGLRARNAAAAQGAVVLTCRRNGATVKTVPLRLTVLAGEAPAQRPAAQTAPAPVSDADVASAKARLGFDFATASKDELLAHDLPPRPDMPSAYGAWLRAVTSPTKSVVRAGIPTHARNQTSNRNWSGYSVNGTLHEFQTTSGEWYIPQLHSIDDCGIGCYASVWDGIGGSALAQDGTESYTDAGDWEGGDTGYFVAIDRYYLWYEYFPASENLAFYGYAGDDVWCESWLTTPSSNSSGAGYYCKDNTTGLVLSTTASFPTGTGYYSDGATVSWILEAPVVGGYTVPLPDYANAYMWGAYGSEASNGAWFGYSQRTNVNYTMKNGSTTLSTASSWSGGTYGIAWTWYNYY